MRSPYSRSISTAGRSPALTETSTVGLSMSGRRSSGRPRHETHPSTTIAAANTVTATGRRTAIRASASDMRVADAVSDTFFRGSCQTPLSYGNICLTRAARTRLFFSRPRDADRHLIRQRPEPAHDDAVAGLDALPDLDVLVVAEPDLDRALLDALPAQHEDDASAAAIGQCAPRHDGHVLATLADQHDLHEHARPQHALVIVDLDLGAQRTRARADGRREPQHLAGELLVRPRVITNTRLEPDAHRGDVAADEIDVRDQRIERRDLRDHLVRIHELPVREELTVLVPREPQDHAVDRRDQDVALLGASRALELELRVLERARDVVERRLIDEPALEQIPIRFELGARGLVAALCGRHACRDPHVLADDTRDLVAGPDEVALGVAVAGRPAVDLEHAGVERAQRDDLGRAQRPGRDDPILERRDTDLLHGDRHAELDRLLAGLRRARSDERAREHDESVSASSQVVHRHRLGSAS